jgi:uncharacterized coiled-coil protein SlyX
MSSEQYLNDIPDLTDHRIQELEFQVQELQKSYMELFAALKETQRFMIQIGKNQSYLAERVSSWPFVRRPEVDED